VRRLAIPMVALLIACDPLGDLGTGGGCFLTCPDSPPVAFAVSPDSANILAGDTLSLMAWNCPNGGCLLGNPVVADWTVTGDAVVPVPTGSPSALQRTSLLLLRASGIGESLIHAVAADDATKQQAVRVTTADSSAITSMELHTCCSGRDTVLTSGDVSSSLFDGAGKRYRAYPTEWSVSDDALISLGAGSRFGSGSRTIQVRKAGVVEIRARFLNVEGRMLVTVKP